MGQTNLICIRVEVLLVVTWASFSVYKQSDIYFGFSSLGLAPIRD